MSILLNNVNVDDTSETKISRGGPKIIFIRADDFGGGSVLVEVAPPNDPLSRFGTLKDGSFSQDSDVHIDYLPVGARIRVSLTGSTGASNVFVGIS